MTLFGYTDQAITDGEVGAVHDRHYYAGSCAVCKTMAGEAVTAPLSVCGACRAVRYCCRRHQRLDWPRHRPACRFLAANLGCFLPECAGSDADDDDQCDDSASSGGGSDDRTASSPAPDAGGAAAAAGWRVSRLTLALAMSRALGRQLSCFEREMVQFAPVCQLCARHCRAGQMQCPRCRSAFYCGRRCLRRDHTRHARWCAPLLTALRCDRHEWLHGPADPSISADIQRRYRPLAGDMRHYIQSVQQDSVDNAVGNGANRQQQQQEQQPEQQQQERDDDTVPCDSHLNGAAVSVPATVSSVSPDRIHSVFVSERLTFPLSVLFALEQLELVTPPSPPHLSPPPLKLSERRSLTLHVVGAEAPVECAGIIKWECLLHRLPMLRRLRLVFVGPELLRCCGGDDGGESGAVVQGVDDSGATRCDDCAKNDRLVIHELHACTYHQYWATRVACGAGSVDAIVCFNAGLHEHERQGAAADTWQPSLPLLSSGNTPLILTGYTRDEVARDTARLGRMRTAVAPQLNPFASLRPYRDPDRRLTGADCFYLNQFIAVLTG